MKRQLLILFALSAVLLCVSVQWASAAGVRGGHGHGFGRGFGLGIVGGGNGYGWDIAELYRELLNNVPYYALHPPVYYSEPVPRTYGYSPFAYPPGVMTPEIIGEAQPVTIINPFVPKTQSAPADEKSDRAASIGAQPEPLVIVNPFVTAKQAVATNEQ